MPRRVAHLRLQAATTNSWVMRRIAPQPLFIAAALVVLGGVGLVFWRVETPTTASPAAQGASVEPLEQARTMLRARASRLAAGDVDGYLQPLSASARAVEEPIARGAVAVPLAEFDLVLNPGPDVAATAEAFSGAPVDVVYRYKGLPDDNVFRFTITEDITLQDGTWRVTGSSVTPDQRTALPIWATGAVQVATSAHFLALSRPSAGDTSATLTLAEQARTRLVAKLPLVIDEVHLLVLASDQTEFDQIAGTPRAPGILGYASFVFTGGLPQGRHMVIDVGALFGSASVLEHQTELQPIQVFQHELGHLALMRYIAPNVPGWVNEGAAMYLSGERRTEEWRSGLRLGIFDRLSVAQLSTASTLDVEAYPYANAAVLYLIATFGPEKFFEFYGSYKAQDTGGGSNPTQTLMRRDFGIDESTLDIRTRAWIRAAVGAA